MGSTTFKVTNQEGKYVGELNKLGQAHGWGRFVTSSGDIYEGTFNQNKVEGYSEVKYNFGISSVGEIHDGILNRKRTIYFENGDV